MWRGCPSISGCLMSHPFILVYKHRLITMVDKDPLVSTNMQCSQSSKKNCMIVLQIQYVDYTTSFTTLAQRSYITLTNPHRLTVYYVSQSMGLEAKWNTVFQPDIMRIWSCCSDTTKHKQQIKQQTMKVTTWLTFPHTITCSLHTQSTSNEWRVFFWGLSTLMQVENWIVLNCAICP